MYIITCPDCSFSGLLEAYTPSCADECTCPECGCFFTMQWNTEEEE